MYTVNMFGNTWWNQQVKNATPTEHRPPEKCDFCAIKIESGDFYYGGYDANKIYAETCENIRCHQWLITKKRGKKL